MPNRKKHVAGGIFVGLTVGLATAALVEERDRWVHMLTCTLSGAAGAVLPDVIEPALNPNHRSTAHSIAAGLGLGVWARARHYAQYLELATSCELRASALPKDSAVRAKEVRNARFWRLAATALLGTMTGYGSHLMLDGMTPKGLPLLI